MVLRPRLLLAGAGVCAVAFVALLVIAYGWREARWVDAAALEGFLGLRRPLFDGIASTFLQSGNATPVAVTAVVLAALALLRGRPRTTLFVLALVGLTSVSSQALKALLAFPRPEGADVGNPISDVAFPSGHATASMTLAVCLVVVLGPRLRPLAGAVGLLFVLGVSFSMVALGGHYPSDILGGYLLATGESLVLLAALRASFDRFPERSGRTRALAGAGRVVDEVATVGLAGVLGFGLLALIAAVGAALLFRGEEVLAYAEGHTAFVAVAGVLVLSALGLLGSLALAAGRRGRGDAPRPPVS